MKKSIKTFGIAIAIILIVLYATCTSYDEADKVASVVTRLARYPYFQDVHVMIFVGFGFLMSFLQYAGFTATSHAFLVAVFSVLWAILNRAFFARAIDPNGTWSYAPINTDAIIGADFCAGAVLISFGAVLGRITAPQLLLMAFFEVIFYAINEAILVTRYGSADIGGSMVIHTFGAYFGLAFSLALEGRADRREKSHAANTSTPVSDTMAMVGTLFLFCFWPSFNAAMSGNAQERAVINTLLSICSSTFVAFILCTFVYEGKFRMVEVQNSTLAGGVAMGAAADMMVNPYGAILTGIVSGAVSVMGYRRLTSFLQDRYNLPDTCGIHNLHGMPGIIGSLTAIIVAASSSDKQIYGESYLQVFAKGADRGRSDNALWQLAGLGTTLCIALCAGYATGFVLRYLPNLEVFFSDENEYEAEPVKFKQKSGSIASQQSQSYNPIARASADFSNLPPAPDPTTIHIQSMEDHFMAEMLAYRTMRQGLTNTDPIAVVTDAPAPYYTYHAPVYQQASYEAPSFQAPSYQTKRYLY